MADNSKSEPGVNPDIVWGAQAIGQIINRTERQARHLLDSGAIKSARMVDGRWCASRSALLRELVGATS
jgi:hypothetical protein